MAWLRAEAGGVSPVVADFSVGPVAGCFEEGAVAAEADGIAALRTLPGGRGECFAFLEAVAELFEAPEPVGDRESVPGLVQRVLGDQAAVALVALDGAAEALGDRGGVGKGFTAGVLGARDRLLERPDRVCVPVGGVHGDHVGLEVLAVPQQPHGGVVMICGPCSTR